ncbi:MAG: hypothetical protein AB1478_11645, partial [Nitrospirota bacterium]
MGNITEKYRNGSMLFFSFIFVLMVWSVRSEAGMPQVSEIMVTDVTTTSFSVIWKSSEPSTPALNVFDGPDCSTPTAEAVITSQPLLSGDT